MKTGTASLQWEKVHVFISSTFNDMHAERDYLVKRVFPELQDWCERRKLRLVDIDLRWGVTEQDATHNKNVVTVCLNSIDDCRPFFLCFLGQRRGRVPKEGEVSNETFAAFPDLRPVVGSASVTELEILHALISPFLNPEKPAEYHEPAKYAFFYLRDTSYLSQLPAVPAMLRETYTNEWIEDAAEREAHDRELERWREREVPHSNRPFHLYEAKWDPNERTPELMMPLHCSSAQSANIERWQKQWQKAGVNVNGLNIIGDSPEGIAASEFNTRLSTGRLSEFRCGEARLSKMIIKELKESIAERFHNHVEVKHETELQKEIDQQDQFLFTASEGFIEREGDFSELDGYVESNSNQLFVLTADGGVGKSTLLANWVDRYRSRITSRADHSIHFRFIGQSDGTTTVYSLLRLLLGEIKEVTEKVKEEIPFDSLDLLNEWPALLEVIGSRGPTAIVLDALDQLESGLSDLAWLPRQLPANIKLIVSFKRGDPSAEKLYEQFREGNQIKLSEVKPFVDLDDRRRFVKVYLKQYLKELDEQQREALINLGGAENPLYLKVVLSELRVFGAFANLGAQIRDSFGANPISAFDGVLQRLETDPAYTALNPAAAVPLLFGFLAHSRTGLSADELTDLLVRHYPWEVTWPAVAPPDAPAAEAHRRQQVGDAVNLYLRQVRPFMARRAGRSDLFYESFKVAAAQRYQGEPTDRMPMNRPVQQWHQPLAEMYYKQAKVVPEPASTEPLYDVHLKYDLKAALQAKWFKSQLDLVSSAFEEERSVEQTAVDPKQLVLQLHQTFMKVLSINIHRSGEIMDQLHEKGACVVARLPRQRAEVLCEEFQDLDMAARLEPATAKSPPNWPSTDPRHYSELLFHQFEACLWHRHIEVLTDDEFRSRCMELHGPRFFVDRFEELLRRLSEDTDANPFLNELRLRVPIDSEYYRPFLRRLTEGLERDLEQATGFLAYCTNNPSQHRRAEIALRALAIAADVKLNCRREEVQAQLQQLLYLLLNSPEKRARWETVHAYWLLMPRGEAEPLLRIAESETEHPLIRAEAARQLGAVDDAQLVRPLLKLAKSEHYPLNRMALRSARFIQLSQSLTEVGPLEDFPKPDGLPSELRPVLLSIGVDPEDLDLASVNNQTRILLHIAHCSELSVDMRWQESNLLEKVLRLLPCRLICCEAGVGNNNLDYLREYSNSEYRLRTSSRYFHDLLLGPIEHLQLTTDYEFSIQGVEDVEIYARGISEKYLQTGQGVGLKAAASVARAKTMLESSLKLMRMSNSQACVLSTAELPGYQISRILGEERQFMRQMAREAGDLDSVIFGEDNSFFESLLPETVPPHLVSKPADLLYVMLRIPQPKGDVFGMDINYIHAFGFREPDLLQKFKQPTRARAGNVQWRPQDSAFKGKDLRSLDFSRENLRQKDFSHATLSRSTFLKADLTGAMFEEANLRGADLSSSVMASAFCRGANFFQAQLSEADLSHADLQNANFYEAWLGNAKLSNARLGNAILYAASLQGADLNGASLCGVDLRRANLSGANLTGTDLHGARFERARYDMKTVWPEDFIIHEGMIMVAAPIKIANPFAYPGLNLANRAVIELNLGHYEKAQSLQEQAIEMWEQSFGLRSQDLAVCINAFLRSLQDEGHHEQALPLCRRVVAIWEETLGSNHPTLVTGLNNLGLSLVCLEHFDEAEQQLARAVTIDSHSPYPNYWLAKLYQRRGQTGDEVREAAAWRRYLELGAASEERHLEATTRIAELGG